MDSIKIEKIKIFDLKHTKEIEFQNIKKLNLISDRPTHRSIHGCTQINLFRLVH